MERTSPSTENDAIALYQRTYYSLLRSSHTVRIRTLEETHGAMGSSLHAKAASTEFDVAALTYAYLRLPSCIAGVRTVLMGQSQDVFARAGFPDLESWTPVKAPARRRKLFFRPADGTLTAFISSVSDIDDLLPCLTAFQIEWRKLHVKLSSHPVGRRLGAFDADGEALALESDAKSLLLDEAREALGLEPAEFTRLHALWPGDAFLETLARASRSASDIGVRVLAGSLCDYRRAVQSWWTGIEASLPGLGLRERPIYFVSSNAHSIANLASGLARALRDPVLSHVRIHDPEGLRRYLEGVEGRGEDSKIDNLVCYASKFYARREGRSALEAQAARERARGIHRVVDPMSIDVEVQVLEISELLKEELDARVGPFSDADWELLRASDALVLNIDYPLGMAAYHLLNQVTSSCASLQGLYVIGKAATLNGRVGDVMIPNVVHDEHSRNTFLFANAFQASDVAPLLKYGEVFDHQKAVTVKGTLLQNRNYMHVFYREGYTDIEMEAGPYLCALYEAVFPRRHPVDEIVSLHQVVPYEVGFLHYASDTPIRPKESLLSTSLSFHGVDSTYATSAAVLRRILAREADRLRGLSVRARRPAST